MADKELRVTTRGGIRLLLAGETHTEEEVVDVLIEIAFGDMTDREPFTNAELIETLHEFEKKAWLWDSFIESLDEEVEEEWKLKETMENWRGN